MVTLPFIPHLLQVIIETMLTTVCNRFDTMQPNCSHQLLQNNLLKLPWPPCHPLLNLTMILLQINMVSIVKLW